MPKTERILRSMRSEFVGVIPTTIKTQGSNTTFSEV